MKNTLGIVWLVAAEQLRYSDYHHRVGIPHFTNGAPFNRIVF